MRSLPIFLCFIFCFGCAKIQAGVTLKAITNTENPSITLQWNMINYPEKTSYSLYKSIDGVVWEISASNPVFRNYTSSTILAYKDNFSDQHKLYYKVKVYDVDENIVAVSNTAIVDNPKNSYAEEGLSVPENAKGNITTDGTNNNAWQIYPNPVGAMLNLVYKGRDIIKGVINVVVQDATGKAIIKFRAASNNKQLHIDVSNLHAGFYFIRIHVFNEMQMNEKFIKQ